MTEDNYNTPDGKAPINIPTFPHGYTIGTRVSIDVDDLPAWSDDCPVVIQGTLDPQELWITHMTLGDLRKANEQQWREETLKAIQLLIVALAKLTYPETYVVSGPET